MTAAKVHYDQYPGGPHPTFVACISRHVRIENITTDLDQVTCLRCIQLFRLRKINGTWEGTLTAARLASMKLTIEDFTKAPINNSIRLGFKLGKANKKK